MSNDLSGTPEVTQEDIFEEELDVDDSVCDGDFNWIGDFCSDEGNELFCEVDRSFIEDNFNLFGLHKYFPSTFAQALKLILDGDEESSEEGDYEEDAIALYGLIHARFILTARGLDMMVSDV